ncbi:hypothetical protein Tco_0149556 [Tanacetum coccineum]
MHTYQSFFNQVTVNPVYLWEEAPSISLGRGTQYIFGKRHPVGLWEEAPKELIRLWICERLLDVVRWVALGLQRQQARATCGAAEADPKGLQEDIPAGESLGEQCVLLERMSSDHTRVSTWMVGLMTQLIKKIGMRYMRFDGTNVGDSHVQIKRRRVKPRNDDASTLAAQQTQPQPDP